MTILRMLLLAIVIALGTVLVGWWTVPIAAAIFGVAQRAALRPGLTAAVAGALAWGGYLGIAGLGGSPVIEFGSRLALSLQLPLWSPLLVTLLFPAVLAGTTAALVAALLPKPRR